MAIAYIKNNKVVNILSGDSLDLLHGHPDTVTGIFEMYNPEIHPWGPNGECDIEIGEGWRTRLKEKLGYCIFCGDILPVTEATGPL